MHGRSSRSREERQEGERDERESCLIDIHVIAVSN